MKFLLPVGGQDDPAFGYLTTPSHAGVIAGIASGHPWAVDNEAFTRVFDPDRFFKWLEKMEPYNATCLFVAVPDKVGNAEETIKLFDMWRLRFDGWPIAFVAQDGQECLEFPQSDKWSTLFVGGSTKWKESTAAIDCIKRAQAIGKRIHVGRVNWGRRYRLFAQIKGSDEFTCDGTRTRFEGVEKTMKAWKKYMESYALQIW